MTASIDAGRWVTGPDLDWNELPARVERVLEERIARVRAEAQELLTIASVEGVMYAAQAMSRLGKLDGHQLLRVLSQELDQPHRLVSESGLERAGGTRISQFRFRHRMFRKYFHDHLGESEPEVLHEDVATMLAALCGDHSHKIAVQLAHHDDFARVDAKSAEAYLRAGRSALAIHPNREAVNLGARGIECLNRSDDAHRHTDLLLELNPLRADALRTTAGSSNS